MEKKFMDMFAILLIDLLRHLHLKFLIPTGSVIILVKNINRLIKLANKNKKFMIKLKAVGNIMLDKLVNQNLRRKKITPLERITEHMKADIIFRNLRMPII